MLNYWIKHRTNFGKKQNLFLFVFGRWQQKLAIKCYGWVFNPEISFYTWESGTPSNTLSLDLMNVPAKWHLNLSNALSKVHECHKQTDRQTDCTMKDLEKCVGIGRIACTAIMIPPIILDNGRDNVTALTYLT